MTTFSPIGILLSISDLSPDLQNKISLLCEAWWARQFDSAEEFVPNTILYIVIKSLSEGSKVSGCGVSVWYHSFFTSRYLILRGCGQ